MKNIITLTLTLLLLTACDKPIKVQTVTGYAQGTTYSVKYWHNPNTDSPTDNDTLKQSIDGELARIDKLMSNYRDDSAIEEFNRNPSTDSPIPLDKEILAVLAKINFAFLMMKLSLTH